MARTKRKRDRYTTIRFVIWAQSLPQAPTAAEIAGVLDIGLVRARQWRKDWLDARAPTRASNEITPPTTQAAP